MEKVNVAIQSYKKPESLIYTLLSLKKYCGKYIDTIYINDDMSGKDVVKHYTDRCFIEAMYPINIKLRINKYHFTPGIHIPTFPKNRFCSFWEFWKSCKLVLQGNIVPQDEIRYQYAIKNSKMSKLLIIHDDIKFNDDIIGLYLDCFKNDQKLIVVGDLGQCNICYHAHTGCTPQKIMGNNYPTPIWPQTIVKDSSTERRFACRINEWCCMIDTSKDKKINAFFGNFYVGADVGAMWFNEIVKCGYNFCEPLPTYEQKIKYYHHCWQGYSGHSVWVDQGYGISVYKKDMINQKLKDDFGFVLNY